MLCVVIKGPRWEEICSQLRAAHLVADLVELRLDLFENVEWERLATLRSQSTLPFLWTLRSASQGGNAPAPLTERHALLRSLAALQPDYLDLEWSTDTPLIAELTEPKLILSHHAASLSIQEIQILHTKMHSTPAHFYKLALAAPCVADALQLILWARQHKDPQDILISTGPYGQITRILSGALLNPITYAALEIDPVSCAWGQLSAEELRVRYHFDRLSTDTLLYGLIGDPITGSISDRTHNAFFHHHAIPAVYSKLPVPPSHLPRFLHLAKQIPFQGLSVTMPLKEIILPHLDAIDPEARRIGAVNTLLLQEGRWIGYNTDGKGACNALEHRGSLRGTHCLILGTGGSARAIAYEAYQRGAQITCVGRDRNKVKTMADAFQASSCCFPDLPAYCTQNGYDILINCTPVDLPIPPSCLLPHAVVMDIRTRPQETPLLTTASRLGCSIVYGYEMFIEQALLQLALWNLIPKGLKNI